MTMLCISRLITHGPRAPKQTRAERAAPIRRVVAGILALARLGVFILLPIDHAQAAELEVSIQNVDASDGSIRVAACDREHFTEASCRYAVATPAKAGVTVARIESIPAGVYAVQVYHDRNDNDTLDRNWLGWPQEGMGFSRDAPMRRGPPEFDDAAIRLDEPGGRIELSIRYF
jgi:uncharacterized protein (DUF2141 family)